MQGDIGSDPIEVGTKRANAWGFYDMIGNVSEWCADVWDEKAYSKRSNKWVAEEWTVSLAGSDVSYADDEDKANKLPQRVVRGASSRDEIFDCYSAIRHGYWPGHRSLAHGFRLALSAAP